MSCLKVCWLVSNRESGDVHFLEALKLSLHFILRVGCYVGKDLVMGRDWNSHVGGCRH